MLLKVLLQLLETLLGPYVKTLIEWKNQCHLPSVGYYQGDERWHFHSRKSGQLGLQVQAQGHLDHVGPRLVLHLHVLYKIPRILQNQIQKKEKKEENRGRRKKRRKRKKIWNKGGGWMENGLRISFVLVVFPCVFVCFCFVLFYNWHLFLNDWYYMILKTIIHHSNSLK